MSRHPTVKWAQRSDKIYLTFELPDAKDVKINLDPEGKFSFYATKDGFPYEVSLELFDRINVKESKLSIGARNIVYVLKKLEKKWWSRLLKEDTKPPAFLKVDWDKWIDEDDENDKAEKGSDEKKRNRKMKSKNKKKSLLQQITRKLKFDCICKK
ncbi:co-chaperone protein p23-1 isoform X1 [Canna indica]|uniref:Co-chaperone protein p23 n=1 Tax=Canna indica TaxID=4628 RepID=A0AAQ3JZK7_9LILI|nr:co-chaperone protein p23-1 isoform X1 [Canna indica]